MLNRRTSRVMCALSMIILVMVTLQVGNGLLRLLGNDLSLIVFKSSHIVTYRLLIATSLGPRDMATYVRSMRSYRDTNVKFALNCYAGNLSREHLEVYIHEAGVSHLILFVSALPGSKALFWKQFLTPNVTASYDVIWLMDSDIEFDLDRFQLRQFLSIAASTQAPIFQPAVFSMGNKISTTLKHLRAKPNSSEAQDICSVEIMTPFIHSSMWQKIHHHGLTRMNSSMLFQSSWGLSSWWCDLAASLDLSNPKSNKDTNVPACLVVQATPIRHLDTKSMSRGAKKDKDARSIGLDAWKVYATQMNIKNICKHTREIFREQPVFFKSPRLTVGIGSLQYRNISNQAPDSWKYVAAEIYQRHRQQNVSLVKKLSAKWNNKTLIGHGSPWRFLKLLRNVTDLTDNSLLNTTQWIHVLQVYEAMKADNITSQKALFLALMHDFGKVLLLFGEDDANVVCSTTVLKGGKLGSGLHTAVVAWNHDEFGFQKLRWYLPRDMAWVIRYHSLSPLLRGELGQFLTPEERSWFPLLRLLWKYDHLHKRAGYVPVVDLKQARAVVEMFLPAKILL